MTTLEHLVQTPLAEALGWTLFHSLWEGAIIAIILVAVLFAARSPRIRYACSCLAMAAALVGFVWTFCLLLPGTGVTVTAIHHAPRAPSEEYALPGVSQPLRVAAILPWLVPVWIAGVVLFHLRALAGWMAAVRLRSRGVCRAPDLWQQRLIQLRERLRLSQPVMLLETCLGDVPVVIGYLRPAILIPIGLLAGMPSGQVEAILLHELAHIRRRDYLINMLQVLVEGFLFYHPAIWWISSVIRAEREYCCDDLVVAASGNAHEYAAALATLEQTRWNTNEAALAATGGSLVKRIRRLLHQPEGSRTALTPVFSASILMIAAAVGLAAWQAQAPPPKVTPYTKWVEEDVVYIISDEERTAYEKLQTDEEREHFIEQFWLRRDPAPGTGENKYKVEHYRRIAYANEMYASRSGIAGWRTDRGRIYIVYGWPDEIESHPAGKPVPFESWLYRPGNVIFEFVDTAMNGEYPLKRR